MKAEDRTQLLKRRLSLWLVVVRWPHLFLIFSQDNLTCFSESFSLDGLTCFSESFSHDGLTCFSESFSHDGLTCFSESGIATGGLLPQPISPTPQSNLHRSFQNALQCFAPFSCHLWNWFSVCTRGEIEMCVGRRIMLTLFSLCYIALASRCQRENFTYFHKREKTIHRDFICQPIRICNPCTCHKNAG